MPKPYRNPDFPDDRRQRYILKRILTERAAMERIARDTLSPRQRTTPRIVKNYLARIRKKDHLTYLILSQIVYGLNIGVPRTPAQILQVEHACDKISGIIGLITDGTKAVAIARELDTDPVTKDVEYVFYDARNKDDLNDLEAANDQYVGTRRNRMEQKIENASRPIPIRKRILDDENDRGII